SAVLKAVLDAGLREPGDVRVSTLDEASKSRWEEAGVAVCGNAAAVDGAAAVIIAVKPTDVPAVLEDIAGSLAPGVLVISIAAGVRLATLAEHLPQGIAIMRVMPNTPALLGAGMAAASPNEHCTDADVQTATALLRSTGRVVVLPEKQQDAVTALSGSGPAYIFAVAEALIEGGVLLGLPRATATELAEQTLYGAATMVRDSGTHPSLLREQVTSPGGTTAAALREFDRHGLRSAIIAGMEAAAAKSASLGG
ncbi:MAG: pyrroline-5-carboxylate reductase, partial [Micrococcales bacterium]|nr:pyrroline-5-carboxylate reductase [Micrococcales bacterium]